MKTKPTNEALHKCLIVATTQGSYEWMKAPFTTGTWNAATDGHILVGEQGTEDYFTCTASQQAQFRAREWLYGRNVEGTQALVPNNGTLKAEDVLKAMEQWPRVMEKDCEGEDGSGCLLNEDLDCKTCNSNGYVVAPEGSKGYPSLMERVHVKGVGYFMHWTWEKLCEIITILGCTELTVTHGSERTMMRLLANEDMVICMMPAMFVNEPHEPPFFTIHK